MLSHILQLTVIVQFCYVFKMYKSEKHQLSRPKSNGRYGNSKKRPRGRKKVRYFSIIFFIAL